MWRVTQARALSLVCSLHVDPGRLNPIVLLTNGATALPPTSGTNIVPATGLVGLGLIDSLTKLGRSSLLSVGSAALGSGNSISPRTKTYLKPPALGPLPLLCWLTCSPSLYFSLFLNWPNLWPAQINSASLNQLSKLKTDSQRVYIKSLEIASNRKGAG